ncbi:hypothetical protein [uncultured Polaribacter sp.]|uniref:hypothetical protein n=1 Tax=uncultured Polaribacter sp. TaxID=174711 RepID=UPI0030DC431E|tara:strand:- start:1969 stop:2646 length:678 start_codon:yes stop_codon:yes gene_type:complete
MELSKEQLLQIDNYIFSCGIKFYDVRAEIVDHFANILEEKLAKNPTLDFKKEIINIHRNFSNAGFKKLLKEKQKSVSKKFYKQSLKHLSTFFKLPKIIITIALFYSLLQTMNLFEDKADFFASLSFLGMISFLVYMSISLVRNKKKKTKFLSLERNTDFNIFISSLFNLCYQANGFRSEASFLNATYNQIHLAIFVLIILFYWSGEYVFHQNKKVIKEQYPNVIL